MSDSLRYSGPESKNFWDRINAVESESTRSLLFIAGCALQDHERRVFQMLADVAKKKKVTG